MIYLASPYSHSDPVMRRTRFLLAEQVTAHFIMQGAFIYSPIVHCHEMAERYNLPTDFAFWKAYNIDILRHADQFYILEIEGWLESAGVRTEQKFAADARIPSFFVSPEGDLRPCE